MPGDAYTDIKALSKLFANSQITLDVFAEFVEQFKNNADTAKWGEFYHECIPAYFGGNKKAMETFIKNGCSNGDVLKKIENLLCMHPRHNDVFGEYVKEESLSADAKLLQNAFNKIESIRKTDEFTKAIAAGIKGKWKKQDPTITQQAEQIAAKWRDNR